MKPPCGRRLVRRCPYRASAGVVGHRAHARETSKIEVVRAARLAEQHGSHFRRLALTATREAGALAADGLSDTWGLDSIDQRQARGAQACRGKIPPPAIPEGNDTRSRALVSGLPAAAVVRACREWLRRTSEFRMSQASARGCLLPQHKKKGGRLVGIGHSNALEWAMVPNAVAPVIASRSYRSSPARGGIAVTLFVLRIREWFSRSFFSSSTPEAAYHQCPACRIARRVALADRRMPRGASSRPSA